MYKKKFSYIKTFLLYYSVNIPKSLMVYITPQPSSEPWRILHKTLLLYTTLWAQHLSLIEFVTAIAILSDIKAELEKIQNPERFKAIAIYIRKYFV